MSGKPNGDGDLLVDDWTGLYREKWNGLIVSAAVVHPAKFSRALIRHIYQHAIDCGWIKAGSVVVDPFGGVALGAFEALRHGLHWRGVELESRFVTLGEQNISWWNERYAGKVASWGTAQMVQGDSRHLRAVFGEAGLVVSSPPYANTPLKLSDPEKKQEIINRLRIERGDIKGGIGRSGALGASINSDGYGTDPANLGNLRASDADHALVVSSPPYVEAPGHDSGHPRLDGKEDARRAAEGCARRNGYGSTDGQLSAMKEGDISAVISSPPFIASLASDDPDRRGGLFRDDKRRNDRTLTATYGSSDGQLGAMPPGELIVSSPPYQTGGHHDHQMDAWNTNGRGQQGYESGYADENEGGLRGHGDTFWSAARQIVAECHAVLPVGGHAMWVCKDFVRAKKRVEFSRQWAELCESVGFKLVHWHRASLVERHGTQMHADGTDDEITTERISFFRRLAERKGSPKINCEDVLCMVRL
jgi:hypothetical protein